MVAARPYPNSTGPTEGVIPSTTRRAPRPRAARAAKATGAAVATAGAATDPAMRRWATPQDVPRNVILQGDALAVLRALPDGCVQTCVTSPPYYGLRSYDTAPQVWDADPLCDHQWVSERYYREGGNSGASALAFSAPGPANAARVKETRWREHTRCRLCGAWRGELGGEPAIALYVQHLVAIFREVWRVLRADGLLWLNLGDAYVANSVQRHKGMSDVLANIEGRANLPTWSEYAAEGRARYASDSHLASKNLQGVPWRVAFALQDFGWVLRSDIIWAKRNCMPESVTDRPTRSHEYLFLFAKQSRYYYDSAAIQEPLTRPEELTRATPAQFGGRLKHAGYGNRLHSGNAYVGELAGRNKRDVWTLSPQPFPAAHFAVMPTALVEPCVLAGSAQRACESCGAPWRRVVARERAADPTVGHNALRGAGHMRQSAGGPANREGREFLRVVASATRGWEPTCRCERNTGASRSLVLDPFVGAGTVPLVTKLARRDYLGIELNAEYAKLAQRRLALFGRLGRAQPPPPAGGAAPPSLWDSVTLDEGGSAGGDEDEDEDEGERDGERQGGHGG